MEQVCLSIRLDRRYKPSLTDFSTVIINLIHHYLHSLDMTDYELIALTGPTASGKTSRAVSLARRIGGEIISADSRQVYRGMDIGTGKDLGEYGEIPYHLIDITPAGYKYNLYEYLRDATAAIDEVEHRGNLPIICGGTGLYLQSLISGLRMPEVPENKELRAELVGKTLDELTVILSSMKKLHNVTDVDTVKRAIRAIEIQRYYAEHPEAAGGTTGADPRRALIVGVDIPREARRVRIEQRLRARLEEGMVDEVRGLLDSGITPDDLIYYGLEYKFLTLYLQGKLSREDMFDNLLIAIHQFAKRQMTWFRGMERHGFKIHWLPFDMPEEEFNDSVINLLGK